MKERSGSAGAGEPCDLPEFTARVRFSIAIIAHSVICLGAMAQDNTANDWYRNARELHDKGSYEDAIKAYKKSIEILNNATDANSEDTNSWAGKGYALMKIGKYDDALKALNRTNDAASAYGRALILSEMAIRTDVNSSGPWLEKGEGLRGLGRFDESLAAYKKTVELEPMHFPGWQKEGDLLMEMGRYEEALTAYKKAIDSDPTFPRLWYYKGLALWALDRSSEADAAFACCLCQGHGEGV